jgi:hypothetical protein
MVLERLRFRIAAVLVTFALHLSPRFGTVMVKEMFKELARLRLEGESDEEFLSAFAPPGKPKRETILN